MVVLNPVDVWDFKFLSIALGQWWSNATFSQILTWILKDGIKDKATLKKKVQL